MRKFGSPTTSVLSKTPFGGDIINAVGISVTNVETKNSLPQDYTLAKGDIIVCYGLMQDFRKF